MKISKSANREAVMRKAIQRLNDCLRGVRRKPVLLMLSGGSALELLAGIEMQYIGRRVTITVLDERYSKDPAINNFSQISQTDFYKAAERRGADYIDTRIHGNVSLYGLAKKFERGLQAWKKKHPDGRIVITQGIGEDGHTAGIMPYPKNPGRFAQLFGKEGRWVVGYHAGREKTEHPSRITVTLPFLRSQIDCAVVYATGRAKRKALRSTLAAQGTLAKTPARIIHEMKNAFLFTTQ